MMKIWSKTDRINKDKERLINNININLIVDKLFISFINNNSK